MNVKVFSSMGMAEMCKQAKGTAAGCQCAKKQQQKQRQKKSKKTYKQTKQQTHHKPKQKAQINWRFIQINVGREEKIKRNYAQLATLQTLDSVLHRIIE